MCIRAGIIILSLILINCPSDFLVLEGQLNPFVTTVTSNSIGLSWNSINNASYYGVVFGIDTLENFINLLKTDDTFSNCSNLLSNTKYYFSVGAHPDGKGALLLSKIISANTLDTVASRF